MPFSESQKNTEIKTRPKSREIKKIKRTPEQKQGNKVLGKNRAKEIRSTKIEARDESKNIAQDVMLEQLLTYPDRGIIPKNKLSPGYPHLERKDNAVIFKDNEHIYDGKKFPIITSQSSKNLTQGYIDRNNTVEKAIYIGDINNRIPNGEGIFLYPDGSRYQGQVKNGLPNGIGHLFKPMLHKYEDQPNNLIYDDYNYYGQFENGKRQGAGTYKRPNGNEVSCLRGNDTPVLQTHGKFTFKETGEIYTGDMKTEYTPSNRKKRNLVFEGQGSLQQSDGKVVSGIWKDDDLTPVR